MCLWEYSRMQLHFWWQTPVWDKRASLAAFTYIHPEGVLSGWGQDCTGLSNDSIPNSVIHVFMDPASFVHHPQTVPTKLVERKFSQHLRMPKYEQFIFVTVAESNWPPTTTHTHLNPHSTKLYTWQSKHLWNDRTHTMYNWCDLSFIFDHKHSF